MRTIVAFAIALKIENGIFCAGIEIVDEIVKLVLEPGCGSAYKLTHNSFQELDPLVQFFFSV